ncbi:MAG TPA: sigma-70 family RNA polymerase sigma factor [Polyangiaceae bacterium]|nr:sigma-70 family RNA polymerase sigma factor [Polyangiaceae bacterium]
MVLAATWHVFGGRSSTRLPPEPPALADVLLRMPLPPLGGPVYRGGDRLPSWDFLDQDEKSEERFIERLVSHDERAFNELVQAYEQRVFRLVLRMLGRRDEAEDMAQEVFVQVFKAIGTFRGDSKLGTWIYRIAVNLCKNRIKYLSRRHSSDEEELEPIAERSALDDKKSSTVGETSRPDQVVEGYQIEKVVQECMASIDPDFREVLVLRDVEDLSYEELCEVTGLPDGTVKSRLHRARAMLKTAVEQRLGEKIR